MDSINKIFEMHKPDPFSVELISSLSLPVWAYNEEGRVIFWNAESEKKFGYSRLTVLNDPDPFDILDQIKAEPETFGFEKRIITKKGQQLFVRISGTVKTLPDQSRQFWLFGNDITSYKTHEKEQEKQLEHLYNLQNIINRSESIAYIRKNDLNWTITYISSNISRIGYQPEDVRPRQIGFAALIHPSDIARIKAEVLFAIHQKASDIHLEYRLMTKSDRYIWVSDVLDIICDMKGSAVSFQGVITDISLRKSSEEKIKTQSNIIQLHNEELFKVNDSLKKSFDNLRSINQKLTESEEKFKVISEQSLLGIIIIHDGLIKYCNQAFLDISCYTSEDVENWKEYEFINIIHPEDRAIIMSRLEQRMTSEFNEEGNFNFRGITKKGETKWFSQWTKTIMFEGMKSAFVTIIDIDERQKWQESLAESENRLRAKLDFIMSPEKPLGDFSITDIFEIGQLQKIQDAFARSHDITSVITNIEGKPITRPSNISPICNVIRGSKKGKELCELSDKSIGEKVRKSLKPYSAKCQSCGFIKTGAPIIVAGKHIANWMIGQGMNQSIDDNLLVDIADKFNIEGYKLLDAFQNTNFIRMDQFHKIIDFLWIMAKEISLLGYNNIMLARDVEERKKVQDELIRSKNKAEESDRLKSAFLANMSHEIRTPMNGILGFANILNDDDLTSYQRKEYIDIINQNANVLLKLIDDILDIAKMEANQLVLEEKPCYIDQLLHEQYMLFKNQIERHKSKDIKLILKLPEIKLDKLIYADESRLVQILSNLLTNAVKFTQKGSIEFGYEMELPQQLKFYIRDTGIGLHPSHKNIIFDRFRQADETTSRKYGGTGLGLAISKNLVKLMKGNIWVESQPGKGSTFFFTIPYSPFSDQEIIKTGLHKKQEHTYDFSGKQILIAEDEQLNFHFLYEILKNTNAKIWHAKNGKEAIEICKRNALIDLILMDIKMPLLNGYEATRQIKLLRPELPVIAQTACAMPEERNQCLRAGCNDYIAKPIIPAKLLRIIHNSLNRINTEVE